MQNRIVTPIVSILLLIVGVAWVGYQFGAESIFDGIRKFSPLTVSLVLSALLIFWAAALLITEGAIKLYDGGAGGFVSADGGRWVIRTLFWNTQADWFAALAAIMAVPYLATIYVSIREPLAEPPPDSYTSKW